MGTVKLIGQDWKPLNWKDETDYFVKLPTDLHF